MTRALPQQQSLPVLDPVAVRKSLADLLNEYSACVSEAESGAEVTALVREYATACLRELEDVEGGYAAREREAFRLMLQQTEGVDDV